MAPRRDVEPVRVELLVERQVMGGEARQLVGALDGVGVLALVWREAGARTDVDVPPCGPTPLGPFARLPREGLWDVGELDGRAVRRHRRCGSCDEIIGVDDDRAVSSGVADCGVQLVQRLQTDRVDADAALRPRMTTLRSPRYGG